MLNMIKNRLGSIKSGLIQLNHRPIGKAVLAVILFLDLFILVSIFEGLSDHTRQLSTPSEFIPQHCRDIVIDDDWNVNNRFSRTATIISGFTGSYRYVDESDREADVHAVCRPIYVLLRAMENDESLSDGLRDFLRDRNQAVEIKSEIERVRSAYDTSLLEVIAQNHSDKQLSENEHTQYLKQEISKLTAKLNSLTKVEVDTISRLSEYDLMVQFFELIAVSGENNRELLLADLRDLNFWYPVKRLMMELLFLLPLILVFYFWNSRSLRTSQPYQVLVSSHLLIVAFIPVIFKVLELVYEIMPKTFLKKMFALLESFNLVAIWHYLMMGLGIALALGLIYVLQQKIFSHEKLMQKRISKGLCQSCGVQLPPGTHACVGSDCSDTACTVCGFKQLEACSHCAEKTYVNGKYCRVCGS